MTHAELSRKRALQSVEAFIAALKEYKNTEFHPKDRGMFMKRDGILRIYESTALPLGILEDTTCLRDALKKRDSANVNAVLQRLFDADHDIPYSTKTDYPALHAESLNLSREYVEVSSLESAEESPGEETKRPAWERLKLHRSTDGSDHIAELDGKKIRIRGDAALKMLDILQRRKGERVKGTLLDKELRQRSDKVLGLLNKRLQRIIEAPGRGGTGYAML